jgi:DNA helicase II / ATP-dependent DNA helicase PcrA
MINSTEHEEREYLALMREKLTLAIRRIGDQVREHVNELRQKKEYLYDQQSGMDEADHVAAGQSIDRMATTGESAVARRRKLLKLVDSPYFGRIDFGTKPEERQAIYIGLYSYFDEQDKANLIYDWRAPIASMFYDFELGEAWYQSPKGKTTGTIHLKRQYKIRDGRMEYLIESALSIQDDILQRELSKSADDKMKNIVATIQRDQNVVIRNDTAQVMIIQGVAGSGKTSIALHRIAFLLYRHRETLKASDVLILSPNKVFADYIAHVLPELGEEHVPETGMEDLARDVLENKYRFQTFFQQVSALMHHPKEDFIERIRFKSSFEFLSQLNRYLIHLENTNFVATEIRIAGVVVPGPFIQERFRAYTRMPAFKRIPDVVREIQQYVRNQAGRKLKGHEKGKLWEAIPRMFRLNTVMEVYRQFYAWLGKPDLFRMGQQGELEYADVFPLIYCKIRLEGVIPYDHVKHLLIDEMQDYTPVQYAVLSRLFTCKKTILGDIRQTVNPYSASTAEVIEEVFPLADIVRLNRSYRSTIEITRFTQRISHNPDLVPVERHGEEPRLHRFKHPGEEINEIIAGIDRFRQSGNRSMGILCKTVKQANRLFEELQMPDVHLLTDTSTRFSDGVILTSVHLAKGLEFDEVIVPYVNDINYQTELDRSILYIACTRALHQLMLTCSGTFSRFVENH